MNQARLKLRPASFFLPNVGITGVPNHTQFQNLTGMKVTLQLYIK